MKSFSCSYIVLGCAIVVLVSFCLYAQRGGKEFHIPFSEEIVSPHVKWAKPYVLGKTKVLFIPSIAAGRTVIELAQRLDLDYKTVCIDENWAVNFWSYNLNYRRVARHSLKAYEQPYDYLLKALESDQFDVMVLPSIRGWNEMPVPLRKLIMRRVREGMGLVLIHPYEGHYPETQFLHEKLQPYSTMTFNLEEIPVAETIEHGKLWSISPLINCPNNALTHKGHVVINQSALRTGAWKKVANHYIIDDVPLELQPYDYMKYYKYTVSPSAQILIASETGDPICAVRNYGKGRVVGFGFLNYGMIPLVDKKSFEIGDGDHYWEYYFLLLGRSILWAAKKEAQMDLSLTQIVSDAVSGKLKKKYRGLPTGSIINAIVRNEIGEEEFRLASSKKMEPPKFKRGKYLVDVIIKKGDQVVYSGSQIIERNKEISITQLDVDRSEYIDPDIVRGSVSISSTQPGKGKMRIELEDNWNRVVTRKEMPLTEQTTVSFEFKIDQFLTHIGWIHCTLLDNNDIVQDEEKKFFWVAAATKGNWNEYTVDMRWTTYIPIVYPWQKTRDEVLRRAGVNLLDDPYTNFEMSYRAPRNWGPDIEGELYLGWEEQDAPNANSLIWYEKLIGYSQTRDKSYLVRDPCLNDPAYQESIEAVLTRIATEFKRYRTTWYDIGNEQSLMSGIPPLDFCYSPYCLAAFRESLKKEYETLLALNKEWHTHFKQWEEVMPQTVDEVRKTGHFAPWADHRRFMQVTWAEKIKQFGNVIRNVDPKARVALTNVRRSNPYKGVDYYLQERILDAVRPTEKYHKDFRSDIFTFGSSAYATVGEALKNSIMPGVLDGQVGTSAWWYYTCFDPDLTPSASGEEAATYYRMANSGLGKLMLHAKRNPQPIAMHYSMPSANAVWITDGKIGIAPGEGIEDQQWGSANFTRFYDNRNMWDRILADLGCQYTWLAHEQVEEGALDFRRFKVLILPNSISLSKQEIAEIKTFVKQGGVLIADAQPGLMNEHATWQKPGMLDDLFGISVADERLGSGLISNKVGKGQVYLLNQFVLDYEEDPSVGAKIIEILTGAGVTAPVKVLTNGGNQLKLCETYYYKYGDAQHIGIVRSEVENKESVPVRIELPMKSYVYESISGQFLGYTDHIDDALVSSDVRMFSLLPGKVDRWTLNVRNSQVKQGDVLEYTLRRVPESSQNIKHVVHVEFIRPDGSPCWWYTSNALASAKEGYKGHIPLALNEARGKWRIKATDFITGKHVETTFVVE